MSSAVDAGAERDSQILGRRLLGFVRTARPVEHLGESKAFAFPAEEGSEGIEWREVVSGKRCESRHAAACNAHGQLHNASEY